MPRSSLSGVRLAELLSTLSLAVDLGLGQPMGHVARSTVAAGRLAERVGMPDAERVTLFHVALMGWVGCIADSRDAAAWFGDDIEYRAGVYDLDMSPLPFLGYLLRHAGSGEPLPRRVGRRAAVLADRGRAAQASLRAHCQVTTEIAHRLGLPESVTASLEQIFARWDGKGLPVGVGGQEIALPVRIWQLTDVAEVHYSHGGAPVVTAVAEARRGTQFDPGLVDALCADIDALFTGLGPDTAWDDLVRQEAALAPELTEPELDRALEALADWVDLKSPWFTGHSRAVAELAAEGARRLGSAAEEVRLVRRAALVHDLGRAGVPNSVWDKNGPLTAVETERLRLHSYYTERMLSRPPALAEVGAVAALAHERLDGSGYHRGLPAVAIPPPARVLAAADTYRTKREPRPHRPALSTHAAGAHLRAEVAAGRLDLAATEAVLTAAGHASDRASTGPAGLTPREVEVLVRVARGSTNRQVARELGIAPKTVGNHVERIYAKAGVSTRAAATLFAMEHRLLG